MIYNIALTVVCVALVVALGCMFKKLEHAENRIIKCAIRIQELEVLVDRIDKSTGQDIHELRREFLEFRTDYGDAAIEEIKESANAQKTFADGLNSILSYGADLYGRGDKK